MTFRNYLTEAVDLQIGKAYVIEDGYAIIKEFDDDNGLIVYYEFNKKKSRLEDLTVLAARKEAFKKAYKVADSFQELKKNLKEIEKRNEA